MARRSEGVRERGREGERERGREGETKAIAGIDFVCTTVKVVYCNMVGMISAISTSNKNKN